MYGNCMELVERITGHQNIGRFYRGGMRWDNGSLRAGWIVVEKGCNWTYYKIQSF